MENNAKIIPWALVYLAKCWGMKDNPPRCAVDLNTLHSRQQCDQAKMIPLGLRNWELILDFWQATITDNILTSHLEKASNVVPWPRKASLYEWWKYA